MLQLCAAGDTRTLPTPKPGRLSPFSVVGINQFSHLSLDEFKNSSLGFRLPPAEVRAAAAAGAPGSEISADPDEVLPASVDWRAKGKVRSRLGRR